MCRKTWAQRRSAVGSIDWLGLSVCMSFCICVTDNWQPINRGDDHPSALSFRDIKVYYDAFRNPKLASLHIGMINGIPIDHDYRCVDLRVARNQLFDSSNVGNGWRVWAEHFRLLRTRRH